MRQNLGLKALYLMASKLHPNIQARHLCSISQGDGGVSVVSSRRQEVSDDAGYLRQGTKDQGLSSSIHTRVEGELALLPIREVVRAEGLSTKL